MKYKNGEEYEETNVEKFHSFFLLNDRFGDPVFVAAIQSSESVTSNFSNGNENGRVARKVSFVQRPFHDQNQQSVR